MNKPKEIWKITECQQYEISNYLNLRTLPYKLFRGTKLTSIPSRDIPVRVSKKGEKQGMVAIAAMKGFRNTNLLPMVKKLFSSAEIEEIESYNKHLLLFADD